MDKELCIPSCRSTDCVSELAKKYEKLKNYKKAMEVFDDGLKYLKISTKRLEEEKKQMKRRMLGGSSGNSKNSEKKHFHCPVAIFEEVEDASVKVMYPKHLVYVDGKDIQLEEIRAMHYRMKLGISKKPSKIPEVFPENVNDKNKEMNHHDIKVKFSDNGEEPNECNILSTKSPRIEDITKPKELTNSIMLKSFNTTNKIVVNSEKNEENISKIFKNDSSVQTTITDSNTKKEKSHDNEQKPISSTTSNVENLEDKENFLPPQGFWAEDEIEDELTCSTKAFSRQLPSSTPFQIRKSNKEPVSTINANGSFINEPIENEVVLEKTKSTANLSLILELSKERFSQSTSGSKQNPINSKTFVVAENQENNKENEVLLNISNPFNEELNEYFLKKLNFPNNDCKSGYIQINADMPTIRSASSMKLGLEKYIAVREIGKGAYARVLKVHMDNKSSKALALKQQKPACKWEWYISKEISKRLKDKEKERYFINYTKMFVYNNGSLILSDWACYGTILTLMNSIKSAKTPMDRCPMNICIYLGLQLISCIDYLHSCQIVHGDVKPDNFVLAKEGTNSSPIVKLIDYGRSIDMSLFPSNKSFTYVVSTENFTCNEMKENKPWTYQTDLFGLASTLYLLLMGEYLSTEKRGDTWVMKKSLARYMYPELWNPIFEGLLNVPSCSELPNLSQLKQKLQDFSLKMDRHQLNQQITSIFNLLFKK